MEYQDRKDLTETLKSDKDARQRAGLASLNQLDDAIKALEHDIRAAVEQRDGLWKALLAETGGRERPLILLNRQFRYEKQARQNTRRPAKQDDATKAT